MNDEQLSAIDDAVGYIAIAIMILATLYFGLGVYKERDRFILPETPTVLEQQQDTLPEFYEEV